MTSSEHLVQHRHLREHAVARFVDHHAARSVEDLVGDDDAAAHRQAMHEAAIVFRIVEPGLVDAPVEMLFAQLLVASLSP